MAETIQLLIMAFLIYAVVPTLLARICNIGVMNRMPIKGTVAITFDDGPDPRYTPKVLDTLKTAGVRACFFVVGEKAQRHPEIIKRMIQDGHEIGSHGYRHGFTWLQGPIATFQEMKQSSRTIKEITGSPPVAFRPPWGLFNLFSYFCHFFIRQKFVLWSFMSWDWTAKSTSESIQRNIQKKIRDRAILIFHDSDTQPGASAGSPEKMVTALPGIIAHIRERGYEITPLGNGATRGKNPFSFLLFLFWRYWDRLFRMALKIRDVNDENGNPSLFRVVERRHFGPSLCLPDGEILHPKEKICELHVNNDYLYTILQGETNPGKIGIRLARELRRCLPILAKHISKDPVLSTTQFIVGITALHRATFSAGFTSVDIPTGRLLKIISWYQKLVLKAYHPSEKERFYGKGDLTPKMVIMSKKVLFRRYLINHRD